MLNVIICSKKSYWNFVRVIGNSTYRIHNAIGVKAFYRLRVGFSHLREHTSRHNFADILNPSCACALETKCKEHFFLRCHNYIPFQKILVNK